MQHEEGRRARGADDEGQRMCCPTQGHIRHASLVIGARERARVARHDYDIAALQSFGLMNSGDNTIRHASAGAGSAPCQLRLSLDGIRELIEPGCLAELSVMVDLDAGQYTLRRSHLYQSLEGTRHAHMIRRLKDASGDCLHLGGNALACPLGAIDNLA